MNVIPTVFVCQFNEDWWVTVKLMDWCLVLLCGFFSLVGLSLFLKTFFIRFCEIKYLALVSVTSRLTFVQGMKGGDLSYIWPQSEQTMSCLYKNEMKNVQTWISKLFGFCFFLYIITPTFLVFSAWTCICFLLWRSTLSVSVWVFSVYPDRSVVTG